MWCREKLIDVLIPEQKFVWDYGIVLFLVQYNHLYIYTPTGNEPKNENNNYKIPVVSNKKKPASSEHSESIRLLSNLIDPYSARNYWKKHKIIVSPVNPPWSSSISVMNSLDNLSFIDSLISESSDKECKFSVETDIEKTALKRFLRKLYHTKNVPMRIKERRSGYSLFTRWSF